MLMCFLSLPELHVVCGEKVDDLDVMKGHVEDLVMLINPVDFLCIDVTLV